MVRFSRRILGVVAAAAVVIPASIAWACVGLVAFTTVGPNTVQPGGKVTIFGGEFARGEPVHVRLGSADGPILATHPNPMPSTMTSRFNLEVPIPADITPGEHVLVATQNHYDMNAGIPARAVIYVNAPAAPELEPEARPMSLTADEGPSTVSLVLIGLGVAAAGLMIAGAWSVAASRRSSPSAQSTPAA